MTESVLAGEHVPAAAGDETPFRPMSSPYASVALFTVIALGLVVGVWRLRELAYGRGRALA